MTVSLNARRFLIMGMIAVLVGGTVMACQPDDGSGQWKSAPAVTAVR